MNGPINEAFTAPGAWHGGFYALFFVPRVGSNDQVSALLSAIWSFPSLDGCYLRKDRAISDQSRCEPTGTGQSGHLYGVATMPEGQSAVCGSFAMNPSEWDGSSSTRTVAFYISLGSLSRIYDIGAYPFGPMNGVPSWRFPVDQFLGSIAAWTSQRLQFDLGIVGFEVGGEVSPEDIRTRGIPQQRPNGVLWNEGGELRWYGPNLPSCGDPEIQGVHCAAEKRTLRLTTPKLKYVWGPVRSG